MRENIPSMRIWLALAENDLKCSKILRGSGKYSNALFLLQQSVEKSIKSSFSLGHDPEKIKGKFGHDILDVILKYFQKVQCSIAKQLTDHPQMMLKRLELIDQKKSDNLKQYNIHRFISLEMEYEKYKGIFDEYEPLKKKGIELSKPEKIDEHIGKIKEELPEDINVLKIKEDLRTYVREFRELLIDQIVERIPDKFKSFSHKDLENSYIKAGCFNFYLHKIVHPSVLLFALLQPHFGFVRYPRGKQGNPLKDYNKSTPIITKLSELIGIQKCLLRRYREFLELIRYVESEFKVLPLSEFFNEFEISGN